MNLERIPKSRLRTADINLEQCTLIDDFGCLWVDVHVLEQDIDRLIEGDWGFEMEVWGRKAVS